LGYLIGLVGRCGRAAGVGCGALFFFFFFTLVTGPRRSLSLKLSDIRVYEPQIRARLGTSEGWWAAAAAWRGWGALCSLQGSARANRISSRGGMGLPFARALLTETKVESGDVSKQKWNLC